MATNQPQQNESQLNTAELLENPNHAALQEEIQNHGVAEITAFLERHLNQWQKEPLKIAIIGETGVGKSTFINTMRGISSAHPNAAATSSQGVGTTVVRSYPDLHNPRLIYYDLPGIGSANFDQQTYLEQIPLNGYDFFILMYGERFHVGEIFLGATIQQMQKNFYLVRTRIDQTIENKRNDALEAAQVFNESTCIEQVRRECLADFQQHMSGTPRLFILSGRLMYYTRWDFPRLVQALIENAPGLKREALLFSIRSNSHEIVDQKAKKLKTRILLAATLAAGVGAIPIPGISIACDLGILVEEVSHYMHQFGIDDDALQRLANARGIGLTVLREAIFGVGAMTWSSASAALTPLIITRLGTFAAAELAEEVLKVIPIIGQVVGGVVSFATVYGVLQMFLKELTDAAHNLIDQTMNSEQ